MLKKVLFAVLAALVVFAAYVAARPSTYRIERDAPIAAPPEVVYAQIADLHRWSAWSPWANLDPHMSVQYGGAAYGQGATYEWSGNEKIGQGRMSIVAARPPSEIDIQIEFLKPWSQTSRSQFLLQPEAGGTRVSWVMTGEQDFIGKAYGVFVNQDKLVGDQFAKGLGSLRLVAEEASVQAQRPSQALPSAP